VSGRQIREPFQDEPRVDQAWSKILNMSRAVLLSRQWVRAP
jgi:hypothetical protein